MKQMWKTIGTLCTLLLAMLSIGCRPIEKPEEVENGPRLKQIDSLGWLEGPRYGVNNDGLETYAGNKVADFTVETAEPIRLNFFGWSAEEDHHFTLTFPENTSKYGLAQLTYTMCGWENGPSAWDMTTLIMVHNKATDEWYEFTRCITPYGNSFGKDWYCTYYLDITEFLPLLTGETEFRIFYCGWDATDTRAHAVKLRFDFFEQENPHGTPAWQAKIYDSTIDGGNTGYRSWAYGVQPDSLGTNHSIEAAERLGERTLTIPAGTKKVLFRVCLTGHGQDALTGAMGRFPGRDGYKPVNPAEFDENFYTIYLNGEEIAQKGHLWEINTANYKQAGTYKYNRCGWGPGKPCNVQHWLLTNIPTEGETITLNFDLDEYVSKNTSPRAESVAQFYVEVDAYGYK